MPHITFKRAGDAGVDRNLAEQYAEILRLRMRVREAESAAQEPALSAARSGQSEIAMRPVTDLRSATTQGALAGDIELPIQAHRG
jgi:hypothetical protein